MCHLYQAFESRKFVTLGNSGAAQEFNAGTFQEFLHLPLLGDVESPLKQEMGVVVVVEELGDGVVVAAGDHAGGSLLLVDWKDNQGSGIDNASSALRGHQWILTLLLIGGLVSCAGSIATQHLLILADTNTLALDHLQVLETTQHLMVDLEDNLDVELSTLLNGERLVLKTVDSSGGGQVDHDVGTALDDQGQRFDHALRVTRLADRAAGVQAQRGLPAVEGLVILVCGGGAGVSKRGSVEIG